MSISERLTRTEQRLESYYAAEQAALTGQAYTIGTRSLTRADLKEIQTTIEYLEKQVDELKSLNESGGRRRSYRVTPRDL
jgi:hypothetical protein